MSCLATSRLHFYNVAAYQISFLILLIALYFILLLATLECLPKVINRGRLRLPIFVSGSLACVVDYSDAADVRCLVHIGIDRMLSASPLVFQTLKIVCYLGVCGKFLGIFGLWGKFALLVVRIFVAISGLKNVQIFIRTFIRLSLK